MDFIGRLSHELLMILEIYIYIYILIIWHDNMHAVVFLPKLYHLYLDKQNLRINLRLVKDVYLQKLF